MGEGLRVTHYYLPVLVVKPHNRATTPIHMLPYLLNHLIALHRRHAEGVAATCMALERGNRLTHLIPATSCVGRAPSFHGQFCAAPRHHNRARLGPLSVSVSPSRHQSPAG